MKNCIGFLSLLLTQSHFSLHKGYQKHFKTCLDSCEIYIKFNNLAKFAYQLEPSLGAEG